MSENERLLHKIRICEFMCANNGCEDSYRETCLSFLGGKKIAEAQDAKTYPLAFAAGEKAQKEKDRQEMAALFATLHTISDTEDEESNEMLSDLEKAYLNPESANHFQQALSEARKQGARELVGELEELLQKTLLDESSRRMWRVHQFVQSKLAELGK